MQKRRPTLVAALGTHINRADRAPPRRRFPARRHVQLGQPTHRRRQCGWRVAVSKPTCAGCSDPQGREPLAATARRAPRLLILAALPRRAACPKADGVALMDVRRKYARSPVGFLRMNILFRASALALLCGTALATAAPAATSEAQSPTVSAPRMRPPRLVVPPPMRPAPPSDPAPIDWREANDEVQRLRGHAGHLRASPAKGARDGAAADPPRGAGQ
jgi:hypothetical protein